MIEIKNISKTFYYSRTGINKRKAQELKVLNNISLDVQKEEFVTFFGPNGCGKTTLLNILAGLLKPDSGKINIEGKSVKETKVGFVFQNYTESLFPWRTVLGNIEFGLEVQGIGLDKRRRIAKSFLKKFNLLNYGSKYIYELSGGTKQLVALARSLAYDPKILLMDEPFSSLDYQTTLNMMLEIQRVWLETRKTTLFISHYIDEAIFLADRVVVLSKRPGRIIGIVKVDLPRPRRLNLILETEFFNLRNKVLRLFRQGIK